MACFGIVLAVRVLVPAQKRCVALTSCAARQSGAALKCCAARKSWASIVCCETHMHSRQQTAISSHLLCSLTPAPTCQTSHAPGEPCASSAARTQSISRPESQAIPTPANPKSNFCSAGNTALARLPPTPTWSRERCEGCCRGRFRCLAFFAAKCRCSTLLGFPKKQTNK